MELRHFLWLVCLSFAGDPLDIDHPFHCSVGFAGHVAGPPDKTLVAAAIGLVLGGALANATDRAVHGAVADFFHLYYGSFSWYVFNIADVAIVAGVLVLMYDAVASPQETAQK